MKSILRFVLQGLVGLSIACSGGGSGGSSGPTGPAGVTTNGDYEGLQSFRTHIRLVDVRTGAATAEDDCLGDIRIVIDDTAAQVITGDGRCDLVLSRNGATYSIVGGFLNDTDIEGVIAIEFSGVTHRLGFTGNVVRNRVRAAFTGRTGQTSRLGVDWNGDFTATRI